jgi:DNA-binding FadR family transcriptional regulator
MPSKEGPAAVRIAGTLRRRIERGDWPVGAVLPAEAELAREYGVSRPTMREALSALQFAGYVESRRRRGTVVLSAAPVPGSARHPAAAASFAEVAELLEARLVLEPAVLALAATDPDPEALDEAQEAVAGMALVTSSSTIPADTDHRLHALIARTCRNQTLRANVENLLERASGPIWCQTQESAWRNDMPHNWTTDHTEIVAAIRQGDGPTAATISRRHLLSAVDNAAECTAVPASIRRQLHRLRNHFGAETRPS